MFRYLWTGGRHRRSSTCIRSGQAILLALREIESQPVFSASLLALPLQRMQLSKLACKVLALAPGHVPVAASSQKRILLPALLQLPVLSSFLRSHDMCRMMTALQLAGKNAWYFLSMHGANGFAAVMAVTKMNYTVEAVGRWQDYMYCLPRHYEDTMSKHYRETPQGVQCAQIKAWHLAFTASQLANCLLVEKSKIH